MEKVCFNPWIGDSYLEKGYLGKRILVLGESHYCNDCDLCGSIKCDITIGVTKRFLDYKKGIRGFESWMTTYTKFANVFLGEKVDNETLVNFWNSIMFFNYVQLATNGPRISPSQDAFSNSKEAFFEILNEYQPDLIIVWGERLWKNMPSNGTYGEDDILDGKFGKLYYYNSSSNKKIPAFRIYHPSSSYFSYEFTKYLSEALNRTKYPYL